MAVLFRAYVLAGFVGGVRCVLLRGSRVIFKIV